LANLPDLNQDNPFVR